jgi:hypothetical protein
VKIRGERVAIVALERKKKNMEDEKQKAEADIW